MKRDTGNITTLGALDPLSIQVDERTVLDRLSFAAAYGELINFYDKNNQKNGHWRPFFLKDPTVLLAAISKTDYTSKHMLFLMLSKKLSIPPTADLTLGQLEQNLPSAALSNAFLEQLFDLIQAIFDEVNDWLTQMDNDQKTYQLKDFVKKNIPSELSPLLWQFVTLRQTVSLSCKDISAPDYQRLENFQPLWRTHVQKAPLPEQQETKLLQLLQQIYHPLFSFYVQVIDSAKVTFTELKENFNNPPDTALLIAFAQLMEVQQQQLNQMTGRHLNFYYRDILKQQNKPATPDKAYLCLTLSENAQSFDLPVGTQFSAGLDAQKQPVVFASTEAHTLNQATIKQAQTLCYYGDSPTAKNLYLRGIKTPAQIIKNPQGELQSWPLLGDASGSVIQQGFAFATPLLSLQGGLRTLRINFDFAEDSVVSNHYFDGSAVYLSTEKDWLIVAFKVSQAQVNQLELLIQLTPSDPAVCAFKKNPDGMNTAWPMLKLVLGSRIDLLKAPLLKQVEISTDVDQFSVFELYNDFGKLADSSGFLPFGPIPAQGNNFYLGSAELFAKPLTALELQVNWDALPTSISSYYQQYNDFLSNRNLDAQVAHLCQFMGTLTADQKTALCNTLNKIFTYENAPKFKPATLSAAQDSLVSAITTQYPNASDQFSAFLKAVSDNLGTNNPLSPYKALPIVFNNECFKVVFSLWGEGQWQKVPVDNVVADSPAKPDTLPAPASTDKTLPETPAQAQEGQNPTTATKNNENNDWVSLFNSALPEPAEPAVPATVVSATPKPKPNALKRLLGLNKESTEAKETLTPLPPPVLLPSSYFVFEPSSFSTVTPSPALLLQPLDFSVATKAGFLNMNLQQPLYGFGNSLYAQVVMDVTQQNAYQLIQQKDSTAPYAPKPLPNPPYVPKVGLLSIKYSAKQQVDFSIAADNYPFEFYHYDSFSGYRVFDSHQAAENAALAQGQSPGSAMTVDGTAKLFAGISSSACLYLCLNKVEPPCHLTLYFELSHLVALQEGDVPPTVSFYYLTEQGWQTLKILADGTDQLSCSGIIEVAIAQDISPNPPLMPDSGYWLAIASNNPPADFAQAVYLNTQAIKVQRLAPEGLSTTQTPALNANKITATVTPIPQLDTLNQPFASFNGVASENDVAFYQRTSQRIKTKDRANTPSDYEIMALKALPGLYFCKHIANPDNKPVIGEVQLGLVNGYADATLPDAYSPVVSRCGIDKIRQYFSGRMSPFVQLKVFNLSHESVKIAAELKFTATAPVNRLCEDIAQQLKIYLSPWITSDQPQITIDEGISSAALIDYLSCLPEVEAVYSLSLSTDLQPIPDSSIIFPKQAQGLFVSAPAHDIRAAA